MEAIVGGGGGGGGGGDGGSIDGSSSGGSVSTVSKEELAVEQRKSNTINNTGMSSFEVSSYPDDQDDELELGLGLSLGVGTSSSKNGGAVVGKQQQQQVPRILTAKDLPSCISLSMASSAARTINVNSSTSSPSSASSSSSAIGGRVQNDNKGSIGTKRTADSVNSPTGVSQVVGWPPVPAHRVNNLANQAKSSGTGEIIKKIDQGQGKGVVYGAASKDIKGDAANRVETGGHFNGSLFVKVNMYGVGIGRKVDLSVHSSYKSLGRKLEEMFNIPTRTVGNLASGGEEHGTICSAVAPSELFDGSSEFVLTYEDKDGDWMLVGDVPWEMFLSSVKRLRIMKTSDARGLAPRCEERNAKQRTRHV